MTKFEFSWTVKNFRLIANHCESLRSPECQSPISNDSWFLRVYPKSFNEENGEFYTDISVHLSKFRDESEDELKAKIKISIVNGNGETLFVSDPNMDALSFKEGYGFRFKYFVPFEELLSDNDSNSSIESTTLQFHCEITYSDGTKRENDGKRSHDANDENRLYDISEMNEHSLFNDLMKYDDGAQSTLQTMDGRRYKVHRYMLSCRSEYFRELFKQRGIETRESGVRIPNFQSLAMEQLISFIYTDKVHINSLQNAMEIMEASAYFKLPKLTMICEEYLAMNEMQVNSIAKVLIAADEFGCIKLKKKVLQFIIDNKDEVFENECWKQDIKGNIDLIKEIRREFEQKSVNA